MRNDQRIRVTSPCYLSGLESTLQTTSNRVLANYLVWRVVEWSVGYSSRLLRDREQVLYSDLLGRPSRWSECVDVVSSGLYLAVGRMYVKRYFDEKAKNAAFDLIESIRKEMYATLSNSGMY